MQFEQSKKEGYLPLLPHWVRWLVPVFLIAGSHFAYLYLLGGKPRAFEMPVFALVSAYMQTDFLILSQTNILDELGAILILLSAILLFFSRERDESEAMVYKRMVAMYKAVQIGLFVWFLSYLLVYGYAIFAIAIGLPTIILFIAFILFKLELRKP